MIGIDGVIWIAELNVGEREARLGAMRDGDWIAKHNTRRMNGAEIQVTKVMLKTRFCTRDKHHNEIEAMWQDDIMSTVEVID